MIGKSYVQKSIVITKDLCEKVNKEAEDNYTSFNWVIRKVLTEYFRGKDGESKKS